MRFHVNGQAIEVTGAALDKRLIEFLREDLDLTGVKNACDIGACGACSILIDNQPLKICIKRVKDFEGAQILTIEGMAAPDGTLHPLQQAFVDCGAIQCGFCTPGMVMTAHAFLQKNSRPTREQIRKAINGNLCRCTGYQQIIDAIEKAAPHYRKHAAVEPFTSEQAQEESTKYEDTEEKVGCAQEAQVRQLQQGFPADVGKI